MIEFFVPGHPEPGGSKSAWLNKKTGKILVADTNKKASGWKKAVAQHARLALGPSARLLDGPLHITCIFILPRPRSHFRTGKNACKLKDNAPLHPVGRPDATKLWRSTEDALTHVIWNDDAQIVQQQIVKQYVNEERVQPGAFLQVYTDLGI